MFARGGGLPANTGLAGASYRAGFFAGTPAPTPAASRLRTEFFSRRRSP
ncbi:diguanylate cyclase [Pseudomonas sp. NY5710]|nr:diguanylate cyclase [Pseudomonas sp. NY5710]